MDSSSGSSADITVLTPTVPGRETFLEEALASVKAQTLQPKDHFVALDDEYEGPGAMLNLMLEHVETEWFSILPDDDLYDPDHLESLWGAREDADIVYSWGRIEGSDSREQARYKGPWNILKLLNKEDSGLCGVYMARTALWKQGAYPEEVIEDWKWLTHHITVSKARVKCVERDTWTYRFHGDNSSEIIGELIKGHRRKNLMFLSRYF